jgi:RimJ/RimL family protein N-acetyltransferase
MSVRPDTPVSFATKPTLTGDLVSLRPLTAAHTADVMDTLTNTETLRLTGTRRGYRSEEIQRLLTARAEQPDRLDLAVFERATDRYAGEVVLNELDPDNLSCSFRIALIAGRTTDRGLGTEATRLILAHAFDTVGVHRIELEVLAVNPRALHVYRKVGFVHEGTKRQVLRWDGEWIDVHMMALLAPDWTARQHWL